MQLAPDTIKNIATLARLNIKESETATLQQELSNILTLFDDLKNTDTGDVSAMANPHDATQILREDIVSESNQRELFQSIAPNTENGLYLVPKVLE